MQGTFVPKSILCLNLTATEKLILSEIYNLSRGGECFASNRHFAELFGLKTDTVSKAISKLKKLGYVVQTRFDGRKRFLSMTTLDKNSVKKDENLSKVQNLLKRQPVADSGKDENLSRTQEPVRLVPKSQPASDSRPILCTNVQSTKKVQVQEKLLEILNRLTKETRKQIEYLLENPSIDRSNFPIPIQRIYKSIIDDRFALG
jgi:DNA-binding MarR family transcriptional regulator